MTSWRESSDPRCPECGGKITATASYCMHCSAEFEDDGDAVGEDNSAADGTEYAVDDIDADVSGGDDVNYDNTEPDSVGTETNEAPAVGIGSNDQGPVVDLSELTESLFGIGGGDATGGKAGAGSSDGTTAAGSESDVGVESSDHPEVGIDAGESTPTSEADIEKTTLLLRGPVSLIMAFPAAILFTLGAVAGSTDLPGVGYGLVFLLSWVGVSGYLLTKPLASDAIGDAFYVYAVVLLLIPPVWILGTLVEVVLGEDVAIGETMITAVVGEFFLLFPAAFLLLLGYGANYYARQKIESALGERASG